MRVIFYVDGKIFYRRTDFKAYLLRKGDVINSYLCKKGIYWCIAYLERSTKRRVNTKNSYYDVKIIRR